MFQDHYSFFPILLSDILLWSVSRFSGRGENLAGNCGVVGRREPCLPEWIRTQFREAVLLSEIGRLVYGVIAGENPLRLPLGKGGEKFAYAYVAEKNRLRLRRLRILDFGGEGFGAGAVGAAF
jgi:hypothetical protein